MQEIQRKATLLLCAAAIGSLAGAALSPAASASAAVTSIGCSATSYPPSTEFRSHPRECIVYRGGLEDHAHQIWMQKMRWSNWGGQRTIGHGLWHYCGMGTCGSGPLKARAYRLTYACGHYAYTRMRVHVVVRDYHDWTYWLYLSPR